MKKNIKITFGIKYYISYIFVMCLFVLITVICSFLFKNDQLILKILFYILMLIGFFGFLFATLYYYQYAVIDENKITFKSLLCTFGSVNIADVKAIKKESLITFKNNFGFKRCCDWIVFYSNNKDAPRYGLNKKKTSTFMIPYNEKNVLIVKKIFKDGSIIHI